jgi:hypothetical protein
MTSRGGQSFFGGRDKRVDFSGSSATTLFIPAAGIEARARGSSDYL